MTKSQGHRPDGHRLSEFVYGTVAALVAIAGLGGGADLDWLNAALIVVLGAVAIWIAHAYSSLLSRRLVGRVRLRGRDVGAALAESWPIVSAGMLLVLPLLPVGLELWSLALGLRLASLLGIAVLTLLGWLAGRLAHETWPRCLLLAVTSGGLGLAVVVVEVLVHHVPG